MGLKRRIGVAAGGLAIVLVGATAASALMDADWLRARLVNAMQRQTGRQLRIDSLHVWLLPYPWIDAKGVGLTDMPDGGRVEMFTAEEVRARLALTPLFSHRFVLDDVTFMKPSLSLERSDDGRANWRFAAPPQIATTGEEKSDSSAHVRWNVAVDAVHVREGSLTWDDRVRRMSGATTLDKADISGLTNNVVSLDIHGRRAAATYTLAGSTGPFPPFAVAPGTPPWPVHLTTTLAVDKRPSGALHVDGAIQNPANATGYALQITGTLDDLRSLNALFPHANLPESRNVSLQTAVSGDGAAAVLKTLHLHAGSTDLHAVLPNLRTNSLAFDASQPTDRVAVAVDGKLGDQIVSLHGLLGTLEETGRALRAPDDQALPVKLALVEGQSSLTLDGVAGGRRTALDIHGSLPSLAFGPEKPTLNGLKADGHVSSDAPVSVLRAHDPTALMRATQATLDVAAQRVTWRSVAWTDFSAHVTLDKDVLTADPIRGSGSGVAQTARFTYDASNETPHLTISASPIVVPSTAAAFWSGAQGLVDGSLQIVGDVSADGASAAAWRSSLTGHAGASMVGGRVNGAVLASLIGQSIPVHGNIGLRCFGAHMQFADQRATIDRLGLEADLLSMSGHGTVGLADGALDLHLLPHIGVGGASASSPVGVGGSLASPSPHLEPGSNGRFAITVGGSGGEADPCPDLLAAAREGGPGPAAAPASTRKADKLMNLLHGLFH
ncbi:AsmA family protein [Acetobacter sacchari]|uniref:AsmA family protein n=1 Tax=Acetobacter sacchari TaxID=2661687 RepID=A0ABS3LY93_9PROT|nr:AsmA family protein [Acetobacter sacchari]MBO1360880.1 AsmA family protein [Acetobacter sacchari]